MITKSGHQVLIFAGISTQTMSFPSSSTNCHLTLSEICKVTIVYCTTNICYTFFPNSRNGKWSFYASFVVKTHKESVALSTGEQCTHFVVLLLQLTLKARRLARVSPKVLLLIPQ